MVERSISCYKAEKDSGSRTFPLAKGNTMGETHTNNLVHPFSWSQFPAGPLACKKAGGSDSPLVEAALVDREQLDRPSDEPLSS